MLTKEELEERRKGIGGSDVAAIAGLSKYKTPLDVYLEKVEGFYSVNYNDAIHFGNVLEPLIANEYAIRTGSVVHKATKPIISNQYPFMIGNLDYLLVHANAILECKTASIYQKEEWGENDTDFIPQEYLLQVAHYAIITDVEFVDIAVLIGGQEFKIYKYTRNKELENTIINIEKTFWNNHVICHIPPPPKTIKDITYLYPSSKEGSKFVADYKLDTSIAIYNNLKSQIKDIEEEMQSVKVKILETIKDNEIIVDKNGKKLASYKFQSRSNLDINLLKHCDEALYNSCLKDSTFRVFKTYGE